MPIYAYKCASCGFAKDVLRKMSDAALVDCPSCGQATFNKQLTAAGFQLKGSGWYVTDFRGGNTAAPAEGAAKDGANDGAAKDGASAASDAPATPASDKPAGSNATASEPTAKTAASASPSPSPSAPASAGST